jgi:SAM-dependent methyltransferase
VPEHSFDIVMAVFFLHHLPDEQLGRLAGRVCGWLVPGGVFYSLDPNRYRLSGALGRLLVLSLMKKYQTPGERQLVPSAVGELFRGHGLVVQDRMYGFLSMPLAGAVPGSASRLPPVAHPRQCAGSDTAARAHWQQLRAAGALQSK